MCEDKKTRNSPNFFLLKDEETSTLTALTSSTEVRVPLNSSMDESSCINAFQIVPRSSAGFGKNSPPTCVVMNKRGESMS